MLLFMKGILPSRILLVTPTPIKMYLMTSGTTTMKKLWKVLRILKWKMMKDCLRLPALDEKQQDCLINPRLPKPSMNTDHFNLQLQSNTSTTTTSVFSF
jgi:hypothetical protein